MTMMLVERVHNSSGMFGWFNFERRMWVALVLLGMLGGFSYGNGHTTTLAVQAKDAQIAQKDAQIVHKTAQLEAALNIGGCQQKRADTAEDLLNDSDIVTSGSTAILPACPPVAAAVKAIPKLTNPTKR